MKLVRHVGQVRAGRWQCNGCRAAWATAEAARKSRFSCPKIPLPHGHPFDRQHVVYPEWSKDRSCAANGCPDNDPTHWHGPDELCEDTGCPCMSHKCDCDVCTETIQAPALNVLRDSHEGGARKLSAYEAHRVEHVGN